MDKVNMAFAKTLENISDFEKALLGLPHNKTLVQKALVGALIQEIENAVLATYELAK